MARVNGIRQEWVDDVFYRLRGPGCGQVIKRKRGNHVGNVDVITPDADSIFYDGVEPLCDLQQELPVVSETSSQASLITSESGNGKSESVTVTLLK